MLNDNVKLTGRLEIALFDRFGVMKERRVVENLVTTVGKTHMAARLAGSSVMTHMAVGSGAVAAAAGDTALGAELGRVALASITPSATTAVYSATFPAGTGDGAITEAGIFSAVVAGNMMARSVFAVFNKGASDSLTINWTITVS